MGLMGSGGSVDLLLMSKGVPALICLGAGRQQLPLIEAGRAAGLAVGAPGFAGGNGRVLICRGSALSSFARPSPFREIRGDETRDEIDHLGRWLAAGQIYGDPEDDLIIGAPDYHGIGKNEFDTGHAWVWSGAEAPNWAEVTRTPEATAEIGGTKPFQRVGRRPALYDVDDDGLQDILLPTRTDSNE